MGEDDLVIPLKVRARDRFGWSAITAALVVGAVVWIIVSHSLLSITWGSAMIALLGWIWATTFVARRLGRGSAPQLVVTREAISSPAWSLRWDRVQSISIGRTADGSHRALFIEPIRPSDVQVPASSILRVNRLLAQVAGNGRIAILEVNIDCPVEQLMLDLERRAGRELSVLDRGA